MPVDNSKPKKSFSKEDKSIFYKITLAIVQHTKELKGIKDGGRPVRAILTAAVRA